MHNGQPNPNLNRCYV